MYLVPRNAQGETAGGIIINFFSSVSYQFNGCFTTYVAFSANLPDTTNKVWRITFTKDAGTRLVIHCNDIEMLDITASDSVCDYPDWKLYYGRKMVKLNFYGLDTATDKYRPYKGD